MGLLAVLLWPTDLHVFAQGEKLFLFMSALVVWILAEWKQSEELTSQTTSQNDVRVGRELVELHAGDLRYLLKDTDLWTFVDDEIYGRLGGLLNRWERGAFAFTNKKLNAELSDLMENLNALMLKVSQDTVPENIGGKFKTGYKPFRIVPQEEYDRRSEESKRANVIASGAWVLLDRLVVDIKDRIPEVMDQPVN